MIDHSVQGNEKAFLIRIKCLNVVFADASTWQLALLNFSVCILPIWICYCVDLYRVERPQLRLFVEISKKGMIWVYLNHMITEFIIICKVWLVWARIAPIVSCCELWRTYGPSDVKLHFLLQDLKFVSFNLCIWQLMVIIFLILFFVADLNLLFYRVLRLLRLLTCHLSRRFWLFWLLWLFTVWCSCLRMLFFMLIKVLVVSWDLI